MQVRNQENKELFLVIITNSKEFSDPLVSLKTWEEAKEMFEKRIVERDDDSHLVKQITVFRNESMGRLQAQLLRNHKGWGVDYFECIKVEKAYAF